MATIISTKTSGVGGLEVTGDASGVLQLASNNGTTAVTVDASQNVGIGTATPISGRSLTVSGQTNAILALVSSGVNRLDFGTLANYDYGRIQYDTSDNSMRLFTSQYEQLRLTSAGLLQFNSGYGSVATAYGCRAWVNFNGTGTVAIRASGNVSSITDNGTGNYTVNLTTAMPDLNYAAPSTCSDPQSQVLSLTTNSFNIITRNSTGTVVDSSIVQCSVFR